VVEGVEIGGLSTNTHDEFTTAVGFQATAPQPERDEYGRIRLLAGEPEGGLLASLPADVHLYEAERGTPVMLRSPAEQVVELEVMVDGHDLVYLPEQTVLENGAGKFELTVEQSGEGVRIKRTLSLTSREYPAEMWPELRALLLAETDEAHRLIMLK
jgi:hypothetical protein